jgi:hypothetical protein
MGISVMYPEEEASSCAVVPQITKPTIVVSGTLTPLSALLNF